MRDEVERKLKDSEKIKADQIKDISAKIHEMCQNYTQEFKQIDTSNQKVDLTDKIQEDIQKDVPKTVSTMSQAIQVIESSVRPSDDLPYPQFQNMEAYILKEVNNNIAIVFRMRADNRNDKYLVKIILTEDT